MLYCQQFSSFTMVQPAIGLKLSSPLVDIIARYYNLDINPYGSFKQGLLIYEMHYSNDFATFEVLVIIFQWI